MKPSSSAIAYATALSKPLPFVGSSSTKYGGKAGLSVATVRVPGVSVLRLSLAHASACAVGVDGGLVGRVVFAARGERERGDEGEEGDEGAALHGRNPTYLVGNGQRQPQAAGALCERSVRSNATGRDVMTPSTHWSISVRQVATDSPSFDSHVCQA